MDDWQKQWQQFWDEVGAEVEQLFVEIGTGVESAFVEIGEVVVELVEELETAIATEIEDWLMVFDPDFVSKNTSPSATSETHADLNNETPESQEEENENFVNSFDDFAPDLTDLFNPKRSPSLEYHPACIGCRHYHGYSYNDNPLICGMHPFGWLDGHCPDWEGDHL